MDITDLATPPCRELEKDQGAEIKQEEEEGLQAEREGRSSCCFGRANISGNQNFIVMTLPTAGLNSMEQGPIFRKINMMEGIHFLLGIEHFNYLLAFVKALAAPPNSSDTAQGLRYCRQL